MGHGCPRRRGGFFALVVEALNLTVFTSRCLLEKWPCPGPLSLSLQGSTAEDRELTGA